MGATPRKAALPAPARWPCRELVATLCTFLVLSPLALDAGHGPIPVSAHDPGRDVRHDVGLSAVADPGPVPAPFCCRTTRTKHHEPQGFIARAFARWQKLIDRGIDYYVQSLDVVLRHKTVTIAGSFALLARRRWSCLCR